MESGLRLILLGIAFIIIAGILWDAIRSRKNKLGSSWNTKRSKDKNIQPRNTDEFLNNDVIDEELLSEIVVVKETVRNDEPIQYTLNVNIDDGDLKSKQPNYLQKKMPLGNKNSGYTKNHAPNNTPFRADRSDKFNRVDRKPNLKTVQEIAEQIIIIHLMANTENFNGKLLVDSFEKVNLYFGIMNIFHAHENIDGSGDILFSVASAVEPGYFEIHNLENHTTPGLVLFFKQDNADLSSSKANQSIAAFELMLRTAKQLAKLLDADLTDDKRKPLTNEIIEDYRERVRNFSIDYMKITTA